MEKTLSIPLQFDSVDTEVKLRALTRKESRRINSIVYPNEFSQREIDSIKISRDKWMLYQEELVIACTVSPKLKKEDIDKMPDPIFTRLFRECQNISGFKAEVQNKDEKK